MNCSNCESILLTDVFKTPNPIRCTACGHISIPQTKSSNQANRFAWRSFWLGLTSIVLLCLTGIPAIWYGVRSLLQMRFVRSQKNDRKAAIAGICLGLLFGFVGSGIVAMIGAFSLIFMFLVEETKEPERIQEILANIGTIDIPEDFHAVEANRVANQVEQVDWRDSSKLESANGRVRLVKGVTETQFAEIQRGKLMSMDLHRDIEVDESSRRSDKRLWSFAGQEREVTRTTLHAKQGDFEVIRYAVTTIADNEKEFSALAVSIRKPGDFTEADVRKIFESYERKSD